MKLSVTSPAQLPPPRDVCERAGRIGYGDDKTTCPLHECPENERGLCGRVLVDIATLYGGLSQTDVGFYLGVTNSRVGQIEHAAMRKMRARIRRVA